ncbi:MAG: lipid-A-disaccharide synthase [Deltaproteobacteria bacterium]|nr:MAG: lipid-A-disaccharide synthase [Deltaproteobacteria bacterium]
MTTVLLSVGDASGDVYASDFVRELRARVPDIRFAGLGGAEMEKAGVELVVNQRDVAVSGLFELLPDLHRIVSAWRRMTSALRALRPDLVVLVDSSGFNIPFARRARRLGCPTLYYVSPQVWAWRTRRIHKLARWVNQLAVIFPFEPAVYAGTRVSVEYVGHPLVERLRASAAIDRDTARRELGLPAGARIVALLPGSRSSEMRHLLPLQLEVARVLHARDARIHFALPRAASLAHETLEAGIRAARLPSLLQIDVLDGRSQVALRAADAALLKPGTSTLEAALLDCPMVVAARINPLTAWLLRRLVHLDTLTMPNLIAGEAVVPEFLQQAARPEAIADAVLALLDGPARDAQRARLAVVRQALAKGGAAARAAEIAVGMIGGERLTA